MWRSSTQSGRTAVSFGGHWRKKKENEETETEDGDESDNDGNDGNDNGDDETHFLDEIDITADAIIHQSPFNVKMFERIPFLK